MKRPSDRPGCDRCVSGALTVSEVAAAGCAAIFVPFPYAVDDHQTANAKPATPSTGAITVSLDIIASLMPADLR